MIAATGTVPPDAGASPSPPSPGLRRFAPPTYLLGFIGFAILAGFFPDAGFTDFLRQAARWFLLVAMAGLGMNLRLRDMAVGAAPALAVGGIAFALQVALAFGFGIMLW